MESIYIPLALILTPLVFAESNNPYVNTCVQLFSPKLAKEGCHEYVQVFENTSLKWGCRNDTDHEYECEHSRCMLNASDLLQEDKLDEVKLETTLEKIQKQNENITETLQSLRRRCLGGKFKKIWPEETCNPRQYQVCVFSSLLVDSVEEEWKDTEFCQEMARNRISCKTVLDT